MRGEKNLTELAVNSFSGTIFSIENSSSKDYSDSLALWIEIFLTVSMLIAPHRIPFTFIILEESQTCLSKNLFI